MANTTEGVGDGIYYNENKGLAYPLTKMNFRVEVKDIDAHAAFSQVTGIDATVDVIEFRQGNANSLAPVKVPGLVKHGNVTLRFGYTPDNNFKQWAIECVSETRGQLPRHTVSIELIDTNTTVPQALDWTIGTRVWVLTNAWVRRSI